ncbi:uncharacterized protein OCT59_000091 [Rhizophagus irregularis]|uniref:uncharacterized protein n=1 Tax=Rhizophagus irregularis TaxID=588596 RepID=UPI001A0F3E1B|nr:hypothetical protein OCT59_000091 [Rhizophagus irregularis]GBC49614.2 hypothetical protein GLOIN_2v1764925 [Rhizophagus irregularis DAOM 181602=DAOM 197198]
MWFYPIGDRATTKYCNFKGISWKADMKLSCGDLASNSYEKLNIGGRSTPRLDEKDLLKALGTELLVQ